MAISLCSIVLEDPPWLKETNPSRMDFIGFGLLTVWVGCLQVLLDRGQDDDWLASSFIRWLLIGAVVGLILFLVWELRVPSPIVNLRVLLNRNLAVGASLLLIIGAILYSTTSILPRFLQAVLSYPALQAGLVMSPRGMGAIFGSLISGRILANAKLDGRVWIASAFATLGVSMGLFGGLTGDVAPDSLIPIIVVTGFSITCIFVPMATFSMATIPRQNMGDAAGLTNLLRNLGGSVGISLTTTFVTRGAQAHQALLVGYISPYKSPFQERLAALQQSLTIKSGPAMAHQQAYGAIDQIVQLQALLWSYIDQFRLIALACFVAVPLVFLFRKAGGRARS